MQSHPWLALNRSELAGLGCADKESVRRGWQSGDVSGQAVVILAPRNACLHFSDVSVVRD